MTYIKKAVFHNWGTWSKRFSRARALDRSSAARTRRHRERRRQGTRCITVDVNESEVAALVVRGYLAEETRGEPAAIKAAIESVISDMAFELQQETSAKADLVFERLRQNASRKLEKSGSNTSHALHRWRDNQADTRLSREKGAGSTWSHM
jgi:hypothetical protein